MVADRKLSFCQGRSRSTQSDHESDRRYDWEGRNPTLSGLVDMALKAELTRRELAEHVAMLAAADDVDRLRQRAQSRSHALAAWKTGR